MQNFRRFPSKIFNSSKRTFFQCTFKRNNFLGKVLDEVNTALSQGNLDDALEVVKNANIPESKYILKEKEADILALKQEFTKAIDVYSEIIENDTNQNERGIQELYIRMGDCCLSLGDNNSALKSYQRASRAYPEGYLPYERLGNYYLLKGKNEKLESEQNKNFEKSYNYFEESIKKNFEAIESLLGQGMILKFQKKYDEALLKFGEICKIDKLFHEASFHIGDCHYYKGNFIESQISYNAFLDKFTEYVNYMMGLSKKFDVEALYFEVLFKRCVSTLGCEDYPLAIQQFSHYIKSDTDQTSKLLPLAYNKRGYAYFKRHEWNKCVEDNTKALQLDPKLYQAYRDRAEAYECLGFDSEAKEDKRIYEALLRQKLVKEGIKK